MKFVIIGQSESRASKNPNTCYLRTDNWNDFNFHTSFELSYVNEDGIAKTIGSIKIMNLGQTETERQLPQSPFLKLTNNYCSLGQEQAFYEELMSMPKNVRINILKALRDCVYDQRIFNKFKDENAMQTSLLRSVSIRNVKKTFRNILLGNVQLTPYRFQYALKENANCILDFQVMPDSTPPTNVHVLIGRNGVGKTRILSGIADALTKNKDSENTISLAGDITFINESEDARSFAKLVTIVFSAFDKFTPIKSNLVKGNIVYQYVGLKKFHTKDEDVEVVNLRSDQDLNRDFRGSLDTCLSSQRKLRWIEAIQILNSDPILAEYELDVLAQGENPVKQICKIFSHLSSGHRIILLSITKLVEFVEERTLVLIDEPETHLHPPLLASLTRALSNLLIKRNGVAIIATHSPVVLQEVPKSCVTIIDRIDSEFSFVRPTIETFGENVGTLTREAFRLEVTKSGFHELISGHLSQGVDYESLIDDFNDQIGSEGKAIARSIIVTRDDFDA